MNARKIAMSILLAAALGVGLWQLVLQVASAAEGKQASATISVSDLHNKRGPNPPIGSTFVGVQAQPKVGELELPIRDAKVFRFITKAPSGKMVLTNWAYTPGVGTYLWGTSTITCTNGGKIAQGGFVMHIHEDGTGAYALGTRTCPVAQISGCRFDAQGNETRCGACAWNGDDLACATASP